VKVLKTAGRACAVLVLAACPSLAAPAHAGTARAAVHTTYSVGSGQLRSHADFAASLRYADSVGHAVAAFYDALAYNKTTGDTLVIVTAQDCTPSTRNKDFRIPQMPRGWNDRVSSVTTQMGNGTHCDVWFSYHVDFQGECGNRWIHMQADLRRDRCDNQASSFELS
jgi:hypothetical protein